MNKTQWAYAEGYRTALRSLGIKDDETGDGPDAEEQFDQHAAPILTRTKPANAFLDIDRYNQAEKFINDADGPILQEIFTAKQKAKQQIQDLNTLMDIGDKEGIPITNASYGEIGSQLDALNSLVGSYDELSKLVAGDLRKTFDQYVSLITIVTGQG